MKSNLRYTKRDLAALLVIIISWAILDLAAKKFLSFKSANLLFLLIAIMSMSYSVFLVRKLGVATIFYTLGSIFTQGINDIGLTGTHRLYAFAATGIIFDLMMLLMEKEGKDASLEIIMGVCISTALIPIITGMILGSGITQLLSLSTLNSIITYLIIGSISTSLSFIIWNLFRTTKMSLKFEFGR